MQARLLGPVIFILLAFATFAPAAERELEEATAPSSARSIKSPLQRNFLRLPRKIPLFPRIGRALEGLPPFLADTEIEARFRTYYMHNDQTDDSLSEAWALGGSIYYRSGRLAEVLSLEAEFFTSQPIHAPDDRDGTLLLAPGQEGYSVLGLANAKLHYKGVVLTGYRQALGLPYVNRRDTRMTPNTFEGVTFAKAEGTLRFSTGYIWNIKRRNADEFISMAEAAGVPVERGLGYAGVLFRPDENFHAGASADVVRDVLATFYSESALVRDLSDAVELRLEGQFTYQKSDGDELLEGSPFNTWNVGLRASASSLKALLRLGFCITADERAIFSPYGSDPSYVNLMQRTFTRADEKALLLSLSYDFSSIGAAGLSAICNFVEAWDGRSSGVSGDAREVDLTVDYRLPKDLGIFEGLWLRLRGSWLEDELADKNGTDLRVILRYDFPVI